jgi:hypothetical protein
MFHRICGRDDVAFLAMQAYGGCMPSALSALQRSKVRGEGYKAVKTKQVTLSTARVGFSYLTDPCFAARSSISEARTHDPRLMQIVGVRTESSAPCQIFKRNREAGLRKRPVGVKVLLLVVCYRPSLWKWSLSTFYVWSLRLEL